MAIKVKIRMRRGKLESADVFGCYHYDGDEEWLFFKLLPWQSARRVVLAMKQMRLIDHYTIDRHQEDPQRNGYLTKKIRVLIRERDEEYASPSDIKTIVSELVTATGYTLHWIPIGSMLNLRDPMA